MPPPLQSEFVTNRGSRHQLPLFMPVYQPREKTFQLAAWEGEPKIEALIVNAYFLYKQKELRIRLTTECTLAEHVDFDGLLTTDSGAFQGFTRKLYLANKDIVRFQDKIGSDVIAPLDLVTPPGDKRGVAEKKLEATQKRIREALRIAERGIVAGVQQGGKFLDLRHKSVCELMEMDVQYLAIGSLVPFFNTNHDLEFTGKVLRDAREQAGWEIPIHIYGAGEPCEMAFMYSLGATIFDSASYGHFAQGGWYMTPYGALKDPAPLLAGEFRCECPFCAKFDPIDGIYEDVDALSSHNLWTICNTINTLRRVSAEEGGLDRHLEYLLERHIAWFPESRLKPSWEALH